MSNLGGRSFTNFQNVRVKGVQTADLNEPGVLRVVATDALESTLSVDTDYQDSNYQWTLPAKSGGLGITGTFTVNLGAVSANDILSTNVVVSGIRSEDAVVATIQNMTTTGIGTRGFVYLGGAEAGDGALHLTFVNATNTATVYKDVVVGYSAFR